LGVLLQIVINGGGPGFFEADDQEVGHGHGRDRPAVRRARRVRHRGDTARHGPGSRCN
jgi:hypothetical protein